MLYDQPVPACRVVRTIMFFNQHVPVTFLSCDYGLGWICWTMYGDVDAETVLRQGTLLPHAAALVVFPERGSQTYYRHLRKDV